MAKATKKVVRVTMRKRTKKNGQAKRTVSRKRR